MYKLYKTIIYPDGSHFAVRTVILKDEQEYFKLLSRSLKTCEEHLGVSMLISYTINPLNKVVGK